MPLSLLSWLVGCVKVEPASLPSAQPIALDPEVRTGALPNGLTWYVRRNPWPVERAELRLVVDAGSVLEDDDQRGLAHFVEHMAFNGTERFPGNDLVRFLEGLGIRFGAHLNASTSFDTTTYMLQVPTHDASLVEESLRVLDDWASAVTFAPEEIERERGVVLEERRLRLGAQSRLLEKNWPIVVQGSRYADRMPIGTEESLNGFTHDALTRFYRDWYRPDLMAVVVVGDVDPDAVITQIQEIFGDNLGPDPARERVVYDVPPVAAPRILISSDPELSSSSVDLAFQRDGGHPTTVEGWSAQMAEELAWAVLNERLAARSRAPEAPWRGAGGGGALFQRSEEMVSVSAVAREGRELEALRLLGEETERIVRFGVDAAELERAERSRLSALERALAEIDRTESSGLASELVRVFTTGEPAPGVAAELDLTRAALEALGPAEVSLAAGALTNGSVVLSVTIPEKPGLEVPSEAKAWEAWEAGRAAALAVDPTAPVQGPLVDPLQIPGTIVTRGTVPELGMTTWTLSNGAEVWILPTDHDQDTVLLGAVGPGGEEILPDDLWRAGRAAIAVASGSGLGPFDEVALGKRLAGAKASVWPWIGDFDEGVSGRASGDDLETWFQLLHLLWVAPRFDADALELHRAALEEGVRNRDLDPSTPASDAFTRLAWGSHPRRQPWSAEQVAALDLAASEQVYLQRFAGADDFVFVFVGATSPEALEPLVTRYVGSLPAGSKDPVALESLQPLRGVRTEVVFSGVAPKSSVRMMLHGPWQGDRLTDSLLLQGLVEVLQVQLREELRESLGGVYGVNVFGQLEGPPVASEMIQISFTCDPERMDELLAATRRVLDRVVAAPVEAVVVDRIRAQRLLGLETSQASNRWWLDVLQQAAREGSDPRRVLEIESRIREVDAAAIHQAAARWLTVPDRIEVVQRPEGAEGP